MSSLVFASSAEKFCALADRYNTLNAAQQAALAMQAQAGDHQAAEALVLGCLHVVCMVVHNSVSRHMQKSDLYHEGVTGLYKAIEHYDSSKGAFHSYAKQWVSYYLEKAMAEYGYAVRLPEEKVKHMMKLNRVRNRYLQENGYEASVEDLALETGYSCEEVERVLGVLKVEEMDANHSDSEDSFYNPLVVGLQAGETADAKLQKDDYVQLLNGLTDKREAYVVGSLYGVGYPQKEVKELAAELQLTEQRIRQIRQSALGKLRLNRQAA